MSLKDNFNQAVKELLRKDGFVGDEPPKDKKKKSELDKYLEPAKHSSESVSTPLADALLSEKPESEFSQNPYVATPLNAKSFGRPLTSESEKDEGGRDITEPDDFSGYENQGYEASSAGVSYASQSASYGAAQSAPPPKAYTPSAFTSRQPETSYFETEETTVISRNTVIMGNINSYANVTIDGSVKGDVKITKNINISGKVVGDITCNNSTMSGASMQGCIHSKGQVQIDRDSLLLGDISAQYLDLNGKLKGNVDCGGKAEFKTDAIMIGNVTAATITVLDGATIQGYVNTTFLQESTTNIFPEAIAVSE